MIKNSFLKQITLLYVEDEDGIREVLSKRLEKKVKNLIVAKDGQEGLTLYKEHLPDVILTDVTMPKLDGIDMSKQIRELDAKIPIIILSAYSDSESLLKAISCNITGYLTKPIDRDTLFDTLEENAKKLLLEKVTIQQQKQLASQQKILQKIIDVDKHISFVTDFESIEFANKSFLNFFNLDSINNFFDKYNEIKDIFMEYKGYISKHTIVYDKEEGFGRRFYETIEKLDETKRVCLMLNSQLEPKSFFISVSVLNEEKNLFLINLTDITKMTIEKLHTEQKAYFDALTGVYNRNKFEDILNHELQRAKRYECPLSIAILDIDHFKNFNDTYGHLIGDEVLILIANEINKKIRDSDIFARWGGEEFVLLFPETKLEDARKKIEYLRHYVEQLKHPTAGHITISLGVTQFCKKDTNETIFKRCDEALYKAKRNGRNQVIVKE